MEDDDVAFMLDQAVMLIRICDSIPLERKWDTRRTMFRRRLMEAKLILASITGRLNRGLVLCTRSEFAAQVRVALLDFNASITGMARLLGNKTRCDGILDLVRISSELVRRI